MSNDINKLLEDISIRHACKHVSKYIADLENAVGIKLKFGCQKHEFTWSKDFQWYTDVLDTKDNILDYFKQQKSKIFSIEDYNMSGQSHHYKLYFLFKFHPENAV